MDRFSSVKPDIYHGPSFEELEKADTEPEDELKVINQRIKMLGENHLKDLERLYTIQAIDYKADVKNQYLSFDEAELENPGTEISAIEVKSHDHQLCVPEPTLCFQEICANDPIRQFSIENTWDNDFNQTRYTYLSQTLILQKRQQQIMAQRERERKEFEKKFPQSKEEFENKPKDMQIRVARFLVAEKTQKEKLLAEFDWAWRQTEPLEKIFKTDVSNTLVSFFFCTILTWSWFFQELFASEVRSMLLSVVQTSRDPRRL